MAAGGLTIAEFLEYLAPGAWKECPRWPGDLFALTAALLEKSSAYAALGTGGWPCCEDGGPTPWQWRIENLAADCRAMIAEALSLQQELPPPPTPIGEHWAALIQHQSLPIAGVRHNQNLVQLLVELLAYSDECLAGAGIISFDQPAPGDQSIDGAAGAVGGQSDQSSGREAPFWLKAEQLLLPGAQHDDGSSLCWDIHPSRLRVLPKSQTPRSGLSLRSLSHHLALCPPIDVSAAWWTEACLQELDDAYCNILLIPWPFQIDPGQFSPLPIPADVELLCPEETGWFRYSPVQLERGNLTALVEKLIKKARQEVGRVDLVVFPELALTQQQFTDLKSVAAAEQFGLVAGVLHDAHGKRWPENTVHVQLPTEAAAPNESRPVLDYVQNKHHRWRLDEDQIIRYGLSSRLHPTLVWWEGIDVTDREINFIRLRPWLTTCVLVCEDLARMDPVGRFVRAVAPDLVIALLMDGPQLKHRWPAYHATVLADDPGSSVLTLTSLGMVKLSQPQELVGREDLPVIAMWRDPVFGTTEIPLPHDKTAALLTVYRRDTEETTADGRDHNWSLGAPVYGGLHYLSVE